MSLLRIIFIMLYKNIFLRMYTLDFYHYRFFMWYFSLASPPNLVWSVSLPFQLACFGSDTSITKALPFTLLTWIEGHRLFHLLWEFLFMYLFSVRVKPGVSHCLLLALCSGVVTGSYGEKHVLPVIKFTFLNSKQTFNSLNYFSGSFYLPYYFNHICLQECTYLSILVV